MEDVLKKLENDEHYYGKFGKQYLSNSDISTLLTNPLALGKQQAPRPAFLVGGYFHTAILEPDKLSKYKIVDATTRNTKAYKEISGGELCLLQHEVDQIELMTEKVLANDVCKDLIRGINVDYEKPGITELEGLNWKGKADIATVCVLQILALIFLLIEMPCVIVQHNCTFVYENLWFSSASFCL